MNTQDGYDWPTPHPVAPARYVGALPAGGDSSLWRLAVAGDAVIAVHPDHPPQVVTEAGVELLLLTESVEPLPNGDLLVVVRIP
jgi:hypothetical protein